MAASASPRICYVPLDERPCNASFPALHLGHAVELVSPPAELLGRKKTPGDVHALAAWLERELPACDACVASVEQLVYGGLVPSRVHNETSANLETRLGRLRRVFKVNPGVNINLFALIMRTPSYSSADEEPEYYGIYGQDIYERSVLRDRRSLGYPIDTDRLRKLERRIPADVIADYEGRREANRSVLEQVLEIYAEDTVQFVAIPMDDSSCYGYTAADRRHVRKRIADLGLEDRVPVYPGADETGMTLIARAALTSAGIRPSVYPLYRCEEARHHFPKYEGLALETTVTEHIRAAGCTPAQSIDECDLVLALHSGPRIELEASEQPAAGLGKPAAGAGQEPPGLDPETVAFAPEATGPGDATFASCIQAALDGQIPVAVADIAYANGGDIRFMRELDRSQILPHLTAYGGWNTAGNSIGCVLATAIGQRIQPDESHRLHGLVYRLFDDVCYQSEVRKALAASGRSTGTETHADGHSPRTHPPNSSGQSDALPARLKRSWRSLDLRSFGDVQPEIRNAELPWNRLFEVDLELSIAQAAARAGSST